MACNITSILSGNIKELKNSSPSNFGDDSLLNRIKNTAANIDKLDCPEIVYNYFNKLSGNGLDPINSGTNTSNSGKNTSSSMLDLSGTMKTLSSYLITPTSNEFVQTFCLTINGYYKTLIDIIEKAISVVPELLKKIDQLIKDVNSFIKKIALDIKDCILSVLNDVQKKINELGNSLAINFGDLESFLTQCPCAANAIGALFKCSSNTPSSVISCMRDKLSLTPSDSLNIINRFFENTLKANILAVYKMLESKIKDMFDAVMKPLRWLMKKYCKLLNKKFDVTAMIKAVGPAECFFVYTKETRKVAGIPTSYYGMSILDVLKTMKSWADCFDNVCSWSSDIALKIKSYNEKLRLAPRFWIDTYTIDIYNSCIASSSGTVVDTSKVREMFVEQQTSSVQNIIDLFATVKKIRKLIVVKYDPYDTIGAASAQLIAPDPESAVGVFDENTSNLKKLYSGVDDMLIKMTENLTSGLMYNDSYYRIYQQLRIWSRSYITSKTFNNNMQHIEYVNGTVRYDGDYTEIISPFNPEKESTYMRAENKETNLFDKKPSQELGMTLDEYYSIWYKLNV